MEPQNGPKNDQNSVKIKPVTDVSKQLIIS